MAVALKGEEGREWGTGEEEVDEIDWKSTLRGDSFEVGTLKRLDEPGW
jgi:hypothetical protein